jgi:hypothetical protein
MSTFSIAGTLELDETMFGFLSLQSGARHAIGGR